MPPVVAFILQQEALLFQCPYFAGLCIATAPDFILLKLGEQDLKPQSLEGRDISLHDAFGIYGIEKIGSQIAKALLLFYDVKTARIIEWATATRARFPPLRAAILQHFA
jgi:hypothetical protein